MHNSKYHIRLEQQKGVATLFISLMILVILGLITLYTHRSIIIEQKATTNEYKQALAFEAAQSGLEIFMGTLSSTDDTINYKKYFDAPGGGGSNWTLKSIYENNSKTNNKGYFNAADDQFLHNFLLTGLKSSLNATLANAKKQNGDDLIGQEQKYTTYLYSITSINPSIPTRFVLISRGCADTCDYASAFVMTEFTIGQRQVCPFDINGKFEGKNGPSVLGITDISNKPQNSVYNCGLSLGAAPTNTGSGDTTGISGCSNSGGGDCYSNPNSTNRYQPNYSIQSDPDKDAHFKKYFNETLSTFKGKSSTCVISGSIDQNVLTNALSPGGSCNGKTDVVIAGNFSINASPFPQLGVGPQYPNGLTLVVEGDLNMGWGTSTFDGFLYVRGDAKSSVGGSMAINGGAAFAGDVIGELSWAVYADANKARIPSGSALAANLSSGTWRDF